MTSVSVVGDYVVRVMFNDGESRVADLSRWFDGSPESFATVRLDADSDTLVWDQLGCHRHGEEIYDAVATSS